VVSLFNPQHPSSSINVTTGEDVNSEHLPAQSHKNCSSNLQEEHVVRANQNQEEARHQDIPEKWLGDCGILKYCVECLSQNTSSVYKIVSTTDRVTSHLISPSIFEGSAWTFGLLAPNGISLHKAKGQNTLHTLASGKRSSGAPLCVRALRAQTLAARTYFATRQQKAKPMMITFHECTMMHHIAPPICAAQSQYATPRMRQMKAASTRQRPSQGRSYSCCIHCRTGC